MKLLGKIPIPQAFKDDLDEFLFALAIHFFPDLIKCNAN